MDYYTWKLNLHLIHIQKGNPKLFALYWNAIENYQLTNVEFWRQATDVPRVVAASHWRT